MASSSPRPVEKLTINRIQLEQWDRDHVWHPFTPMEDYARECPLIIESGQGCFLRDLDGLDYLDATSSLWCNVHGHRVEQLDQAIRNQLDRVAHSTLLGMSNIPAIELARKLVEAAPAGLTRVFYSDDGATAVEAALKMAFQYWRQCPEPRPEKKTYLSLNRAYHGDTLGTVSVGDLALFHNLFGPLRFPTLQAPTHYCYRCPLGLRRENCQIQCLDVLCDMVIRHADELVAVVIEPLVQGAGGMITMPEGYLRRLREVTLDHDVLLIADEVAVGMGRTGTLFACAQENVTPDFLCLAKGLTGGYLPLAATLTTETIHSAFLGPPSAGRTFYHGHTYTGNPLGAAVALASLELLQGPDGLLALPEKIQRLEQQLDRLRALPWVGDIRQRGMLAGIELVKNRETREPFPPELRTGHHVCLRARKLGVLIRPLGDVVVVMPPLAITGSLLDWLGDVLYNSIQSIGEREVDGR